MKQIKRLTALLLVCLLSLSVFTACTTNEQKLYNGVYAYLGEKYKGVEFKINSHTQDTQASGQYTFQVTCLTTGVEFEVIKLSTMTSDSYYVSHANNKLRTELFELFGDALELVRVDDVQCYDVYRENGGKFSFNEDSELASYLLEDIDSIYRVHMSSVVDAGDAAECIYMFCDILEGEGVVLEEIGFEFMLGGEMIRLQTSTASILNTDSYENLTRLFEEAKTSSPINNIFYKDPDSNVKVIPYLPE